METILTSFFGVVIIGFALLVALVDVVAALLSSILEVKSPVFPCELFFRWLSRLRVVINPFWEFQRRLEEAFAR